MFPAVKNGCGMETLLSVTESKNKLFEKLIVKIKFSAL